METYLIQILNEKNRVIIPEFGALIVKQKNPRKLIFNEFLQYNDGALVNAISKAEKIKRDEALVKVNNYVTEIRKNLIEGKGVKLHDIGVLTRSSSGKIVLREGVDDAGTTISTEQKAPATPPTPAQSSTTTPGINQEKKTGPVEEPIPEEKKKEIDLTNLTPPSSTSKPTEEKEAPKPKETVQASAVKKPATPTPQPAQKRESINDKFANKQVGTPKPATPQPKTQTTSSTRTHTPNYNYNSSSTKKNKWLSYTLWILLILAINGAIALIFIFPNETKEFVSFGKNKTENTASKSDNQEITTSDLTTSIVSEEKEEPVLPSGSETTPAVENAIQEVVEEPVVEQPKASPPPVQASNSSQWKNRYYVVAGVFSVENNADNLVSSLQSKGYKAEKFGRIGSLHAVSYDVFPSRSEAENYMREIHRTVDSDAWIKKR
ncbi:MAG: SPOR domain-containing protein [Bacteroidales bacterium]|nr:SPOR domain-containing protein [Bacteroidales bacterium]